MSIGYEKDIFAGFSLLFITLPKSTRDLTELKNAIQHNLKKVVEFLATHPQVEHVNHPSLPIGTEHIDDIIADPNKGLAAVK